MTNHDTNTNARTDAALADNVAAISTYRANVESLMGSPITQRTSEDYRALAADAQRAGFDDDATALIRTADKMDRYDANDQFAADLEPKTFGVMFTRLRRDGHRVVATYESFADEMTREVADSVCAMARNEFTMSYAVSYHVRSTRSMRAYAGRTTVPTESELRAFRITHPTPAPRR